MINTQLSLEAKKVKDYFSLDQVTFDIDGWIETVIKNHKDIKEEVLDIKFDYEKYDWNRIVELYTPFNTRLMEVYKDRLVEALEKDDKVECIDEDLAKHCDINSFKRTLLEYNNGDNLGRYDIVKLSINVSPLSFAMLGHYMYDGISCFKRGGCNCLHKAIIGQTKNSFVGTISLNSSYLSRFIGIIQDDVILITNEYPKIAKRIIFEIAKQLNQKFFGTRKYKIYIAKRCCTDFFYKNQNGYLIVPEDFDYKQIFNIHDNAYDNELTNHLSCIRCGAKDLTLKDLERISRVCFYCEKCRKNLKKCGYLNDTSIERYNAIFPLNGSEVSGTIGSFAYHSGIFIDSMSKFTLIHESLI